MWSVGMMVATLPTSIRSRSVYLPQYLSGLMRMLLSCFRAGHQKHYRDRKEPRIHASEEYNPDVPDAVVELVARVF